MSRFGIFSAKYTPSDRFFVSLREILNRKDMKTLFEQIAHWKAIGEWQDIKKWYVQSDTYERYYNIVLFVQQNKAKYGRYYRGKILADPEFIRLFGYLDLDYLKNAFHVMRKTAR